MEEWLCLNDRHSDRLSGALAAAPAAFARALAVLALAVVALRTVGFVAAGSEPTRTLAGLAQTRAVTVVLGLGVYGSGLGGAVARPLAHWAFARARGSAARGFAAV